jgi:acyl carrier protein
MSEIFENIKSIIMKFIEVTSDEITMEKSIHSELGASSLDLMNIVSEIEKIYNLRMSRRTLKEIYTVKDLVDWVEKQI